MIGEPEVAIGKLKIVTTRAEGIAVVDVAIITTLLSALFDDVRQNETVRTLVVGCLTLYPHTKAI